MDAQTRKALFRAKLAAQKQKQRIDSPLVRYNEVDQPVCRVCNVPLKSESLWPAHQASAKHHEAYASVEALNSPKQSWITIRSQPHERIAGDKYANNQQTAIKNIKASAAKSRVDDVKVDSGTELTLKSGSASSLPSDFFDKNESKRQNNGSVAGGKIECVIPKNSVKLDEPGSSFSTPRKNEATLVPSRSSEPSESVNKTNEVVNVQVGEPEEVSARKPSSEFNQTSRMMDGLEVKQVKGALPEGFFDNKDADLRARGIEPVKIDIKDEYKEFEKLIQEDLQEVDNRLEEEEFDAAELREEAEALEQKAYMGRVEMLKKQQMELRAAKSASGKKRFRFMGDDTSEESSDGEDEEDNFAVDWRAKHM